MYDFVDALLLQASCLKKLARMEVTPWNANQTLGSTYQVVPPYSFNLPMYLGASMVGLGPLYNIYQVYKDTGPTLKYTAQSLKHMLPTAPNIRSNIPILSKFSGG